MAQRLGHDGGRQQDRHPRRQLRQRPSLLTQLLEQAVQTPARDRTEGCESAQVGCAAQMQGSWACANGCTPRNLSSPTNRRRLQRGFFLQVLVVLLVCPHLLASLSVRSQGQTAGIGIVWAAGDKGQAAAVAAAESFQSAQRQQQPFLANTAWSLSSSATSTADAARIVAADDLSPLSVIGHTHNVSVNDDGTVSVNRSAIDHVSIESVLEQRWGQTASYLPTSNVIVFSGGQIVNAQGGQVVTNDVFAMDMGANVTKGTAASDAQQQSWRRLSSAQLPPHAFAARAITHEGNHTGERLFLIGGATADCSISNSPVYVWSADDGETAWHTGHWRAPIIAEKQVVPPRRRGATAVQVPVWVGLSGTAADEATARGGTSFMVLGGSLDYTTCNSSLSSDDEHPVVYPSVDVWTIVDGPASDNAKSKRGIKSNERLYVRTVGLNPMMNNVSVYDYSHVVLPGDESKNQSSRVMFIGGRDAKGAFAPMNQLWMLDLGTSMWQHLDTTNGTNSGLDIPLGRMGHSSTLLDDGTVLVHGGFDTLDAAQMASNDSWLLDPRVTPAVWNKVTPSGGKGTGAPRRAYHSATMANGILVLGFGQESRTEAASKSVASSGSDRKAAVSSKADELPTEAQGTSAVHYLDTTAKDRWTWTTSLAAVRSARTASIQQAAAESANPTGGQASAASSSASNVNANSQDSSTPTTSAADAPPSLSSQAEQAQQTEADSRKQPATEQDKSGTANNAAHDGTASSLQTGQADSGTNDGSPTTSSKQRNTAVIAGVLGAAAIVASLGGLYAARRRQARRLSDGDSISDEKYERFDSNSSAGHAAPPVSSLWINQPVAWANSAGRGLKRHASMASGAILARTMSFRNGGPGGDPGHGGPTMCVPLSPSMDGDDGLRYSSPAANGKQRSFQVLRSRPPTGRLSARRSEMERRRDVRTRLSSHDGRDGYEDEDEGYDGMVDVTLDDVNEGHGRRDIMTPLPEDFLHTLLDDDDGDDQQRGVRRGPSMLRTRSTESLSSVGNASHFSYPYLAAMHRPSLGDMSLGHSTMQSRSPTSSQGAGMGGDATSTGEQSPVDCAAIGGAAMVVSPREALLRASLSRSPGSKPLFMARETAVLADGCSSVWSSPALSAVLTASGGKNARLVQRLQGGGGTTPALPDLHLNNPFADPPAVADTERAGTELDLATTVFGGEEADVRGSLPFSRPSLFPRNPAMPSYLASPAAAARTYPMARVPLYQQPSTGVHLPLHPALLNAAAAAGGRQPGPRRAKPSLLRVTNQNDDARLSR